MKESIKTGSESRVAGRAARRLEKFEAAPRELFEFRSAGIVPAWLQAAAVVALFVSTVYLTHAEYVARGTCFGYSGPAFNMLINPIYEELIL